MKWLADRVMRRRAREIVRRLTPHLLDDFPSDRDRLDGERLDGDRLDGWRLADVGAGTGHNAEAIRRATDLDVREFDVTDLHWVGPPPTLFQEPHVPAASGAFDVVLLMFVLQYPESPAAILSETRRLSRDKVIVVQSTYRGRWGWAMLSLREFAWGRLAYWLARLVRIVAAAECPLRPRRFFTREQLLDLFQATGLELARLEKAEWRGCSISRDLFVLKKGEG